MERNDIIFKRIAIIFYILMVVAVVIILRIIDLQYIHPTEKTAEMVSFRDYTVEAVRGDILAHDGRTLASSIPYYKVLMDCTVPDKDTFNKYIDALSASLSNFYKDKSAAEYKTAITKGQKKGNRYLSLGDRLVDYSELAEIKGFPLFNKGRYKSGIIYEEKYKRKNPYGRKAYRTIGFVNKAGVGVGIEGTWDYYLKGKEGHQLKQQVLGGEWIPVNADENVAPQNGYDIRTTLNIDFQEAVENALKAQLSKGDNIEGATAVVMETKTGAIRAIANLKNDGKGGFDESLNYAVGQATEPGSVLKLVTLVALLEDGFVTLDSRVNGGTGQWSYLGQRVTDSHAVGMQTVKGAFAHSSNVCFAKLVTTYYANDPKRFVDRVQNMKLGEKFHLDIQGEAVATIHSPDSPIWTPTLLASMGFGYGMLITPLHTLTFYNAIANGGKMMKPYFVEDYETDGEVVKEFKPQEMSGAICSKETAKKAREALRAVVTEGTGRGVNNADYHISGKTGTARIAFPGGGYLRNGMKKYQATFCGYFPSENPAYSMIVILYSGETAGNFYGASWAGPVFKEIADFIYANSPEWRSPLPSANKLAKNTTGKRELDNIAEESDSLADVVNMGLKDALYLLENQGFQVSYSGYGKVLAQSPEAGARLKKNGIVTLTLNHQ